MTVYHVYRQRSFLDEDLNDEVDTWVHTNTVEATNAEGALRKAILTLTDDEGLWLVVPATNHTVLEVSYEKRLVVTEAVDDRVQA